MILSFLSPWDRPLDTFLLSGVLATVPQRMKSAITFSDTAVRILAGLVGHASHHVRGIHAGLVPWVWSHGVPFLESGVAAIGEGILKAHRVTPDPRQRSSS